MKIIAAIFAILGIIISGVMAILIYQTMETIKATPEYQLAVKLGEEAAKQDAKAKKAMDDFKEAQMKLYGLCATPIVGILALVLLMKGMGLISGLLFMVAGIGPYLIAPAPVIFVFTGWFVVAGLFALLGGNAAPKQAASSSGYFKEGSKD